MPLKPIKFITVTHSWRVYHEVCEQAKIPVVMVKSIQPLTERQIYYLKKCEHTNPNTLIEYDGMKIYVRETVDSILPMMEREV